MLSERRLVVARRVERKVENHLHHPSRVGRGVFREDRSVQPVRIGAGGTLVVIEFQHDDIRAFRRRGRRRRQVYLHPRFGRPVTFELALLLRLREGGRGLIRRGSACARVLCWQLRKRRHGIRLRQAVEPESRSHRARDEGDGDGPAHRTPRQQPQVTRRRPDQLESGGRRRAAGEHEDADDADVDRDAEETDHTQEEERRIGEVHRDGQPDRRPGQQVARHVLRRFRGRASARPGEQQGAGKPDDAPEGDGDTEEAPVPALVDLRATDRGVDVADADVERIEEDLQMHPGGSQ